MKALDTPVLLAVLHDTAVGRRVLREVRGHEVATTEWNMLELKYLALTTRGPPASLRGDALDRLRRRLTVVQMTQRGVDAGATAIFRSGLATPYAMIWGPLIDSGCTEWITTRAFAPQGSRFPLKVRIIDIGNTKRL